jgi:hypothetical protein
MFLSRVKAIPCTTQIQPKVNAAPPITDSFSVKLLNTDAISYQVTPAFLRATTLLKPQKPAYTIPFVGRWLYRSSFYFI